MANWFEGLAKKGYLGDRAKVAADTGTADWSSKPESPKPPATQPQAAVEADPIKRRLQKVGG